jgi:hypothetical protein
MLSFSRSRVLGAVLALVLFCLSLLFPVFSQRSTGPALPHKHQAVRSVPSSTPTPPCPDPKTGNFVVVFYHTATGAGSFRCISQQPAADGSNWDEQVLKTPIEGVYEACASGAQAFVSYNSWEDPKAKEDDAIGSIDLVLQDGECKSVQRAIDLAAMAVTSVVINPFLGGQVGPTSTPVPLIHRAPVDECATRTDFFTIWYAGGAQKICFANAGVLTLSSPLTGVVKVCGGANSGEALFVKDPSNPFVASGIALGLGSSVPRLCVTPDMLLGEASITVTIIVISPVQ